MAAYQQTHTTHTHTISLQLIAIFFFIFKLFNLKSILYVRYYLFTSHRFFFFIIIFASYNLGGSCCCWTRLFNFDYLDSFACCLCMCVCGFLFVLFFLAAAPVTHYILGTSYSQMAGAHGWHVLNISINAISSHIIHDFRQYSIDIEIVLNKRS